MNIETLRFNDSSNLRYLFHYIKNHVTTFGRLDLKIYIQGIHIFGNRPFDDYGFNLQPIYTVHCKNLANLQSSFPNIHYLNYNSLLRSIDNLPTTQIPINIFDFNMKYCNLRTIHILQPVNQEQFIQFINRCPKLNHLDLNRSLFDQNFFDQLNILQFDLYYLEIRCEPLSVNIDFLSKLEYLHYFIIDQKLTTNYVIRIVKKLKCFRRAIFFDSDNVNVMCLNRTNAACINVSWEPI